MVSWPNSCATLLHATPTAPHWSYLGEVGALLREYLVVLYGIDLKYQGRERQAVYGNYQQRTFPGNASTH